MHSEPLQVSLPDLTVQRLDINYVPFAWPRLGKFEFQGSFSIQEPWIGHKEKKWYAEQRRPFDAVQSLVAPHIESWIQAECTAALVPDSAGQKFSVQVNGVTLDDALFESPALRRRMLLQKLPIQVTTCAARILGGGSMPSGDKRAYVLLMDIKRLSR